jgi:ribose/xylose/arabinose/galactoside ABC-type transport system permease subunit
MAIIRDKNGEKTFSQTIKNFFITVLKEQTILIVFIFIIIGMGISSPVFLTKRNLLNIFLQSSMIGITACGMTFVILMAEIDLSVGSMAAFAGVVAAKFQVMNGWGTLPALSLTIFFCFCMGIVMGIIVAKLGVHSFVVTLGMLSIARGFALIISEGHPISGLTDSFKYIGQGRISIIPFPALVFLAIAVVCWFFLSQTKFGRGIYAIGGNKEASRLSGIPVDTYKIVTFGVCSTMAGISGVILAGRVNSGQPIAAEAHNLDAIASVIIGGTSLFGGRGGIWKTIVGTLILGILRNGLNLIGVTPYWQRVFIGALIVVTVVTDRVQHRKEM